MSNFPPPAIIASVSGWSHRQLRPGHPPFSTLSDRSPRRPGTGLSVRDLFDSAGETSPLRYVFEPVAVPDQDRHFFFVGSEQPGVPGGELGPLEPLVRGEGTPVTSFRREDVYLQMR
jgi:hypothetical protein